MSGASDRAMDWSSLSVLESAASGELGNSDVRVIECAVVVMLGAQRQVFGHLPPSVVPVVENLLSFIAQHLVEPEALQHQWRETFAPDPRHEEAALQRAIRVGRNLQIGLLTAFSQMKLHPQVLRVNPLAFSRLMAWYTLARRAGREGDLHGFYYVESDVAGAHTVFVRNEADKRLVYLVAAPDVADGVAVAYERAEFPNDPRSYTYSVEALAAPPAPPLVNGQPYLSASERGDQKGR